MTPRIAPRLISAALSVMVTWSILGGLQGLSQLSQPSPDAPQWVQSQPEPRG